MTTVTTTRRPGTPRHLMAERARWSTIIAAGSVTCRRCHQPIQPGTPWDLGHPADRPYSSGNHTDDLAPEHRHCNRAGLIVDQAPTFAW